MVSNYYFLFVLIHVTEGLSVTFFIYFLLLLVLSKSIGDFHNVFKFHACSINKKLFLTAKLAGACPT